MKKLLFTATILSAVAFSSCKSEKEKVVENVAETATTIDQTASDAVASTQQTAQDMANAIPTFASSEAATYAKNFSDYVGELKAVAASGDQAKLAELTSKAVEFQKELQGITQNLSAEDAEKLKTFVAELQNSVQ